MNESRTIFKSYDFLMILILICLMTTSLITIYSASKSGQYNGDFIIKQSIFYFLGFILSLLIAKTDLEQIYKFSWIIYGICLVSLLFLMVAPESIARPINGAKAWFQILFIGSLQPSEFMKLSYIISISWLVDQHYKKIEINTIKTDLILLSKIALLSGPPTFIVLIQPDTGMTMLYIIIIVSIIVCSRIKISIVLFLLSIPIAITTALLVIIIKFPQFFQEKMLNLLMPHQRSRIEGWLNPFVHSDAGYQTKQGLLAIGTGQLFGKGYSNGTVYIPEEHTDFIFANIGEEFGFIGSSVVLILFFFLLSRIFTIALKVNNNNNNNNLFGSMVCVGILSVLTFQIFQNIGMTIGILPVTGITLPFLSYGGSSLLSNMILIGLTQSVRNSYKGYIFYNGGKYEKKTI